MPRLFAAAIAVTALTSVAAVAADLPPVRKAPGIAPAACAQFGGGYIGVQGGSVTHDTGWTDRDNWADRFSVDIALGHVERSKTGGAVGPLIGYNLQRGCTVFGIEADWSWTSAGSKRTYTGNGDPTALAVNLDDKVRWFGTVRTRTGLVVDNLMLYATGGFAFANIRNSWQVVDQSTYTETFTDSGTRWGWTAGVGTEWAWTNNLSIKSEVLYVRFAERSTTGFSPSAGANFNFDHQDSLWVARLGLNYRWGGR
jgi:outer membrane immunogenic protein